MQTKHRPPTAEDLDRIVAAFDTLMHRIMATHATELSLLEMTMSQTKAMYVIVAEGQLRMSELAHRLGVTNSTATGQVDRLVELGLVARHEDPMDRRQVVVTPTVAGTDALEQFRELNSHRMRQMLGRLDAADLPTIERAVRLLDDAVRAELAMAPGDPATSTSALLPSAIPTTTQKGDRS